MIELKKKRGYKMEKAKVYFTKELTPEKIVELYKHLGVELKGKVAVKVHSGEEGNQNYLKPEFLKPMVDYVNGTIVECNTAYDGARDTTEKHEKLMEKHEWTKYFQVDILDAKEDLVLEIPNGKVLHKNYVGKNIENYDSMLVLSHFKGHPMGGYGGAIKQLSIGVASSKGKRYIHCCGQENGTYEDMFKQDQLTFLDSMVDAASSVVNYFKNNMAYINLICNLSVDCDCCAVAKDPCMKDIGIVASTDPVAIDAACIDLIKNSEEEGKEELLERIESRQGYHTIESANNKIGTKEYELIDIDAL